MRSLSCWNWLRRGTWVSGRMNWQAFFHVLVFASLLGTHVYTALGVHATVFTATDADEYAYMRAALSVFHGSGSYWLSPPPPERHPERHADLALLVIRETSTLSLVAEHVDASRSGFR